MYEYFFAKHEMKGSKNSVKFENLGELKFCEILPYSVRYGMYM